MDMAELIIQSMWVYLSPWKKYKRYSDMTKVDARLVSFEGQKLMEVQETVSSEHKCPGCSLVLSLFPLGGGRLVTYLETSIFHERYKPLDTD